MSAVVKSVFFDLKFTLETFSEKPVVDINILMPSVASRTHVIQ